MHKQVDYLIVGGGSAGCALAARLSEDPTSTVLLLEAGPRDSHPLHHIPAAHFDLGARYTWQYRSTPQSHAHNRVIDLYQGKLLGGGSAVNAMIVMRGAPADYDEWADTYGCTGWSYHEVLPYFIRSEANANFDDEYHGTEGPIGVCRVPPHPLTAAFVQAAEQAGIPYNADFNGPRRAGSGFYQTSIRRGLRSSASVAYLRPALGRRNLSVRTGITVHRLAIEGGRAVGVQIVEGARLTTIRAAREVIVTAGAIGSPKLLLLSGIGPAAELEELGIPCRLDQPAVGRNLQDHARIDLHYELSGPHSLDRQRGAIGRLVHGLEYLLFRRGAWASNNLDGGGFWWTDRSAPDPNLQFFLVPMSAGVPYRHGCSVNFYEVRPRSRGTVRLASADPLAQPLIDPNYLAAPLDLARALAGIELCRSIMRQPALRALIRREHLPGPEVSGPDLMARYVRDMVATAYHLAGTCRMGSDRGAVVGPDLSVHGIAGLRVCDASIMPTLVSGNTNATAIMIAEKAADLIAGRSAAGARTGHPGAPPTERSPAPHSGR